MLVVFKVNLGSNDAQTIGVDFKECTAGSQVECEDSAGKWLVANGIAADVTVPKPQQTAEAVLVEQAEDRLETVEQPPQQDPKPFNQKKRN